MHTGKWMLQNFNRLNISLFQNLSRVRNNDIITERNSIIQPFVNCFKLDWFHVPVKNKLKIGQSNQMFHPSKTYALASLFCFIYQLISAKSTNILYTIWEVEVKPIHPFCHFFAIGIVNRTASQWILFIPNLYY